MGCKGICIRHKAPKPTGIGRYVSGQKRCQICEIFIMWDEFWCPCCGYRLRTRPRNLRYKIKLRERELKTKQGAFKSLKYSNTISEVERQDVKKFEYLVIRRSFTDYCVGDVIVGVVIFKVPVIRTSYSSCRRLQRGKIEGAKIALLNSALEIEKTEFDAKLNISSSDQMQKFLNEEKRIFKSMVDKTSASGANVVLCQKGIDYMAQQFLAREGIIAARRINESDMTKLAKATGATMVTNTDELSKDDIGLADLVEERKVETDKWVFIEGCRNPKSVTILIRGGSQRVVDEAERSIHDALMAVRDVVEYPYVVVGGGVPEAVISRKLREWSGSLASRQQLAAEKYADAVESIPLTLA